MENRISRKALALLCSPPSLIAMAVLLVNDHVLRRLWPSWVTGKLGDFAWLFFFPFALAWGWALILPRREGWVRGLAFGMTGGIFALAKTVPVCHAVVVSAATWVLGRPVGWVRDPSDLAALVSLAAAWRMWGKMACPELGAAPAFAVPLRGVPERWGRPALIAAALLTVANAGRPPTFGVEHLRHCADGIYSLEWDAGYVSRDGGLSWKTLEVDYGAETTYSEDGETWLGVSDLCPTSATVKDWDTDEAELTPRVLDVNGTVHYRYVPGEPIERSVDGGATWQDVYVRTGSPADETYYERMYMYYAFHPGPLDALLDPETGNLLFAMGAEGVLVQTPDGAWVWAEVGPARRVELRRGEGLLAVLYGELMLAAGFGLLAIMTLFTRWRRSLARKIFLGLYWLLWGLNVVMMLELQTLYTAGLDLTLMLGGCIYLLVHLGIETALMLSKQVPLREIGRVALTGLAVAVVFWIPYALWVLAVVPWYGLAAGLGVVLGFGVMVMLGRNPAPDIGN